MSEAKNAQGLELVPIEQWLGEVALTDLGDAIAIYRDGELVGMANIRDAAKALAGAQVVRRSL